MFSTVFNVIFAVALCSQACCQVFQGKLNLPGSDKTQQVGYNVGPLWGQLSQTHNSAGVGGPITIDAGGDFKIHDRYGLGGSLSFQPKVGGQGSVYEKVNILDGPNHYLDLTAKQNQFLSKDLKPFGPPTNSLSVNYHKKDGIAASIGASRTRGGQLQGNIEASIPIIKTRNGGIDLGVKASVGQGMKPQEQIGVKASLDF